MNNPIKYCRFKGYKLQVSNIQDDIANTITGDSQTGNRLNMICQDRDRFVLDIPICELDCIWKFENDWRYETIEITHGEIESKKYPKQYDPNDSENIHNFEFASYNGIIYRSLSGYGHKQVFKLLSYNSKSQNLGFIMEKPILYYH